MFERDICGVISCVDVASRNASKIQADSTIWRWEKSGDYLADDVVMFCALRLRLQKDIKNMGSVVDGEYRAWVDGALLRCAFALLRARIERKSGEKRWRKIPRIKWKMMYMQ